MFGDWDPKTLAEQVEAPTDAVSQEGTISWSAADDAIAYALFKNGEFVAVITEGTEYELEATEDDELTIRAANSMGGFGESQVISVTTGISELNRQDATTQHTRYYNTQGVEVSSQYKGVVIKVQTLSNGKKIATKVLK